MEQNRSSDNKNSRSYPGAVALLPMALSLAWWFFLSQLSGAAEIDRLIAAVNGVVITEGDLDLARSVKAVFTSDPVIKSSSRDEEISRLVDRELMRQELKNFSMTQEDESRIEARMQTLRAAYAGKGGLSSFLLSLGLQESELSSSIRLESSILQFIDFRFRPFIAVSEEEIRNYYESRLALQLDLKGLKLPPLSQVTKEIEVILKEEKINAALDQWIQEIRRNSRIEYYDMPMKEP